MIFSHRSQRAAARCGTAAAVAALAAFGAFIAGSPAMAQSPQNLVAFNQQQLSYGPPFGLVWAHEVYGIRSPYGGMGVEGMERTLQAARADGIDAVNMDCFNKASQMDNTMQAGDQIGMMIAPEIDMSVLYRKKHAGTDEIMQVEAQTIVDYCNLAGSHRCAAKTRDGRYIIWLFGSHQLTPDQQSQVLSNARSQGARFYIIGDLGGMDAGGDPVNSLTRYASIWDASYEFLPLDDSDKPGVKGAFVSQGKPFIECVMPQYTRSGQKIYLPPDGGARYGAMWQEAIQDRAAAVIVVTLNDTGDGSNIMPDYESQTKQLAQQYKSAVLGR
jgi:hypothetical protein